MQQTNYEVRVGLFALGALILLVWGWTWLKSFSVFQQPQRFAAEFSDVAGLSRNALVNVQGVRVGTVEYMEFTPQKKIIVHIKVTDPTVVVPKGSKVSIQTLGLVGAKYVEVTIPKDSSGKPLDAEPLTASDVVMPPEAQDPIRTELVLNRVAVRIDEIVASIDTNAVGETVTNLNQATSKLNKNMDRLRSAADSVQSASESIASTSGKFGHTADNATIAAERASSFFNTGNSALHEIESVARDFRGTSSRVNKLLENPNFSADIKETVIEARKTAEVVNQAMTNVSNTLKDKQLRDEVVGILQRVQNSSDSIRSSLEIANKISSDQGLRSDLKEIVNSAKDALTQANCLLSDPEFKGDIKGTLCKVQSAATNLDKAAKQVQQVLSKRAPLLQLLFGQPGKLQEAPANCPPTPGSKP